MTSSTLKNGSLNRAKIAKSDEFYTRFEDIQHEINAYVECDPNVFRGKTILLPCDDPEQSNFTRFFAMKFKEYGLKKLISTSYVGASKQLSPSIRTGNWRSGNPLYDEEKNNIHGRVSILLDDMPVNQLGYEHLNWRYLEGDGDFRDPEIRALRDESDFIITNPPFSLFREFLVWIMEAGKQFSIIGNMNAITYKEVFPLIKQNNMWLGPSIHSGDRKFWVPDDYPLNAATCGVDDEGRRFIHVKGVRWYTNIDHNKRHTPLFLSPARGVLQNTKHKELAGKNEFDHYDNYEAIEIPYVDSIPDDWDGMMGVPISFLDKYCPEQFEIVGSFNGGEHGAELGATKVPIRGGRPMKHWNGPVINGVPLYKRIIIKRIGHQRNSRSVSGS